MKNTLEFNLPEESEELEMALNAAKAFVVIENISTLLRNKSKYENKKTIEIDTLRDYIIQELEHYNIRHLIV